MKILNVCHVDYAGVGINLTDAVNQCTDHEARHLCETPHHFGFKTDICTDDPAQMRKWIKWADVVNCHVYTRPLARAGMKPPLPNLIMTQHGRLFRTQADRCRADHKKWGAKRVLCTTADLTRNGATWIPTAINFTALARMRRGNKGVPIVCQTPSNPARKDTAKIVRILGSRRDVRLRIIHHKPHRKVLRAIRVADILIDRFDLGLGVSGLEAAAMGIPVIAGAPKKYEDEIIKHVGYLPYYKASIGTLGEAVDALLSNQELWKEYSERSTEYIRTVHDFPVVAEKYVAICEEVMRSV